jgi:osmoprotectant transport system ATP-binding protein
MITLKGVSKSFGTQKAVDAISLEANVKEVLVLLGTSGCGKTTTLKMINRLIEPDGGTILINGKNIKDQKPEALRKTIGFVMQHAGLFPHYTVAQNIATLPDLLRWDVKKTQHRTAELLEKLNLPQTLLTRYPHELSGGQQQRIGIARALIADTPVLLMDEPFGALDNITKAAIHKEFKSLDELTSKTTILVTHDVEEAFELGHRICLMDMGRIVQTGTPHEMLYRPVNSFVKNFFASNRLILEYKIAKLSAVKPYLTVPLSLSKEYSSGNVWQALQIMSTESRYAEGYEELIQAFNQYRKLLIA